MEAERTDQLDEFRKVSVAEARRSLADLINRAHEGQERIVLTRRGKPVAVLVPPEDVELLVDLEDLVDMEKVEEYLAHRGEEPTIPWEQVKKEFGWDSDALPD
jgi:prevent-host-death family protein